MDTVLAVKGLTIRLDTARGSFVALSGVDLAVRRGEILALVGESGSGKSLTALAVMRLLPEPPARIVSGEIWFDGIDLAKAPENALARLRGNRMGMIFQEPMTSLNPALRVGPQVAEAIRLHRRVPAAEARRRVEALFARVRIPDPVRRYDSYPHQMSGGMRQRVMIALAISCDPDVIIADEPTTALDVTTQAQILDIFRCFRDVDQRSTVLITHDMAVVAETADRVAVMYGGQVIETADVETLFSTPRHPYTQGLLAAIPRRDGPTARQQGRLVEIPGMVPALWDMPQGCAFVGRCSHATAICRAERPALVPVAGGGAVACFHPGTFP
jgi:peptide/nickel transport system ATP-binding protein